MRKKLYFIAPIVALALFGAYTWQFNKEYDKKEEEKAAVAKAARDTKLKQEADIRKKAMEEALVTQARMKKDKADKEAEELRRKEARQAAIDLSSKNYREMNRLSLTAERLHKDVRVEEEQVTKIENSIKYSQGERVFEIEYVKKAKAQVVALQEAIAKVEAAEKAAEAAAAAAAATAKKS